MNTKNIALALVAIAIFAAGAWVVTDRNYDHHEHEHHDEHGHDHHEHEEHHDEELVAKEPVRADGTFSIATSFYPLEFALSRITGDLATVTNIGAGRDPHDFRPSTQDILALQRADLVVLHGAELEPWGDDVQDQLKAEDIPVVLATAELDLMEAGAHHDEEEHHDEHEEDGHDDHGHSHGDYDPHTWLDPVLMSETVQHLTEAIVTLDPENAETYEANAAALQVELATLNAEYTQDLAMCEVDEVITSHDAFGYIAERYNFEIHSIAGLSTQDLPSAQTLAELRAEAAEGMNAILLEENSVTAYGETLANETGLQTLSINPIAFSIPEGSDYLSLMRANLEVFKTALNCNA